MTPGSLILLALAAVAHLAALAALSDLRRSDPATHGLTQAAAGLALLIGWALLAGLAVRERGWSGVALAAPGALAGLLALRILSDRRRSPRWPLLLAAAGPPAVALAALLS